MRSKVEHDIQADRNKDFFSDLGAEDAPYDEWALVALFYTMVHAANGYLVSRGRRTGVGNHDQRASALASEAGPDAAALYEQFYKQSRLARYECAHYKAFQLKLYRHMALTEFPALLTPPTAPSPAQPLGPTA